MLLFGPCITVTQLLGIAFMDEALSQWTKKKLHRGKDVTSLDMSHECEIRRDLQEEAAWPSVLNLLLGLSWRN